MILSSLREPFGFGPILGNFVALNPPRPPLPEESMPQEPMPEKPTPEEPSNDDTDIDFDDNLDEMPMTDDAHDDANWEVFIPDELERDPLPEPGDFWPGMDAPWN